MFAVHEIEVGTDGATPMPSLIPNNKNNLKKKEQYGLMSPGKHPIGQGPCLGTRPRNKCTHIHLYHE